MFYIAQKLQSITPTFICGCITKCGMDYREHFYNNAHSAAYRVTVEMWGIFITRVSERPDMNY